MSGWSGPDGDLGRLLLGANSERLKAYDAKPLDIYEHGNIERATAQGGYGRRQLYELVQNGADAIHEAVESGQSPGSTIHVVLTDDALYCANHGAPIDERGLYALLSSHISDKRGAEIGRYGLGFKSVLGVTNRPEFYSRTVSFRFDAQWSADAIADRVPDFAQRNTDDRTPVLRLAEPIDPAREVERDPILKELMKWATTVVKLPLTEPDTDWLIEDVGLFPEEFLLFSPHVSELILESRTGGSNLEAPVMRQIVIEVDDDLRRITEGATVSQWKVFEILDYEPTLAAKKDAGELAKRDSVPIIWAVPTSGRARQKRGVFWAFFPTHYGTTLKGIVNAPWKTNEDRQNLLEGTFNRELIDRVAALVVDHLPDLVDRKDPGRHLELLPARGREAPEWADEQLTEKVYELAKDVPSLPDQNGDLRLPAELKIFPSQVDDDALREWASHRYRPSGWCHHTVAPRERRARAVRLIEASGGAESTPLEWLEAVSDDATVGGSGAAIRAAAALLAHDANTKGAIRAARFVLTNTGSLVAPDPETVFLPRGYTRTSSDMLIVDPDLVEDEATRRSLVALGLLDASAVTELRAMVSLGLWLNTDWEAFWTVAREADPRDVKVILQKAAAEGQPVWVKSKAGVFSPLTAAYLEGEIVTPDDDPLATVDAEYHADDLDLLRSLGLSTGPTADGGSTTEQWFASYRAKMLGDYLGFLGRRNPNQSLISFDRESFPGPLSAITEITDGAKARLTEATMALVGAEDELWVIGHQNSSYERMECPSPVLWHLRRNGFVRTSQGPISVADALGPHLAVLAPILPVAIIAPALADLLGLPAELEKVPTHLWVEGLARAQTYQGDDRALGSAYASAAQIIDDPPDLIRCRRSAEVTLEIPSRVTVVSDTRELQALRESDVAVLVVGSRSEAATLVGRWGLRPPEEHVRTEIHHLPTTLRMPITDKFRELAFGLTDDQRAYSLQPCETLQVVTLTGRGRTVDEIDFRIDHDEKQVLYVATLEDRALLRRLSDVFSLGLEETEIESILENRKLTERMQRLSEIAAMPEPADRLLALVEAEALRHHLPETLIATMEDGGQRIDDRLTAQLMLAAHGIATLKVLRHDLEVAGWPVPSQWAGSRAAQEFVADLGFDESYAGSSQPTRPPLLSVDGPADLPDMHPFQASVANGIRHLVRGPDQMRGLVSLPTGAGKTRIAVESLISEIRDGVLRGPILWVAETDELCEQAVQAWQYVWRAKGAGYRLHINRLWSQNEARPEPDGPQVVVATIAKLEHVVGVPEYGWLAEGDCLIIDEAHGAVTPTYTRLLEWYGARRSATRAPLLGLTATPFRGTSEEGADRLAARFGRNRIEKSAFGDAEVKDIYAELQQMGVLAKVDHELLDGSEYTLTDAELEHLTTMNRLPPEVGERVGADRNRNQMLLEHITSLPDDWPVLVFAASVDHAETLAALLNYGGVSAASISAGTERGVRRHYIEQFRSGNLRVLTNYGVLAQGFDAPATRAVYVARPTFSPNIYQQMIGRGLRGPLNGGKDVCLIVNVQDTFQRFGRELAFGGYDYLWDPSKR